VVLLVLEKTWKSGEGET